jgi:hypothetical protein
MRIFKNLPKGATNMSGTRLGHVSALALAAAVVGAVVLSSAPASAQDEPKSETKEEPKAEAKGETKAEASVGVSTKAKAPSGNTEADSDHASFVGAFAVGYLGASEIPFVTNVRAGVAGTSPGTVTMTADAATVNAPIIGMRYWLSDLIGIDAGFGIATKSSSTTQYYAVTSPNTSPSYGYTTDVVTKDPSSFGMLFHAGVPLALHAEKHWVFQAVPEVNVGFSSGTQTSNAGFQDPSIPPTQQPNDIKLSGFRLDVGARVGAEVHFGFIGVPNLSLQAGIGLYSSWRSLKAKGGGMVTPTGGTPETSYSQSSWTLGSSVSDSPWAIFTKNVAALYYF